MLSSLMLRIRRLFGRSRLERELDEEMRYHRELAARQHESRGVAPAEARRLAALEFGSVERFKEEYRDVTGVRLLEDAWQDFGYALRSLRRSPAFTATAVGTLALGIAAAAAVFAVVDGVLLQPLPYAEADRLVRVWQNDRASDTQREPSSIPDYFDYLERTRTLDALAAYAEQPRSMTVPGGAPERVVSIAATHTLMEMLGTRFTHGRGFTASEDVRGATRVVVLADRFWRSRFAADPGVIGTSVSLDGQPHTIIGVLAPGEEYPGVHVDVWEPLAITAASGPRFTHDIDVIARVAPGSTGAQATADIQRIMAELEQGYPQSNTNRGGGTESLRDVMIAGVRTPLLALMAAVGLLLLTAVASVANLLLARSAARARETAVRSALGAGRMRMIRHFVTETMSLTIAAGLVGGAVAWLLVRLLVILQPADLPRLDTITVGPRVIVAVALLSIVTALVFAVLPVLQSRHAIRRGAMHSARGTSAGGRPAVRRTLVSAQLALSLVLLIGAGLLVRSFTALAGVDPGFTPEHVLKIEYQLPETRYPRDFAVYPSWPEVQRFYRDVLDRVETMPGVTAAALAAHHPLHVGFTNSFVIPGREDGDVGQPEIRVRSVTAGYLAAVGARLVAGRGFQTMDDAEAAPVALINAAAAALYFPDSNAIGRSISFWGTERRIIGIVADERIAGLAEAAPAAVYTPLPQTPMHSGVLLLRTTLPPLTLAADVRRAMAEVDPELALFGVEPLDRTVAASIARERLLAVLFAGFAVVALLLALTAVYGLVAYLFAQRSHEIGIRSALGATPSELRLMFLKEGIVLGVGGIAAGLAASAFGRSALAALLFGIEATDPVTWIAAVLLLLAVAAAASWLPARSAGRTSPLAALNAE
ncbi:ABC transporter permease [soil metagenome]